MIERNPVKHKVEIEIAMTDDGEIKVKTTSGNHCINLGMIEIAKVIIQNQMQAINVKGETASRIKLI